MHSVKISDILQTLRIKLCPYENPFPQGHPDAHARGLSNKRLISPHFKPACVSPLSPKSVPQLASKY